MRKSSVRHQGPGRSAIVDRPAYQPAGFVFRAIVKGRHAKGFGVEADILAQTGVVLAHPDDDVLFLRPLAQLVARPVCPIHQRSRVTGGNDVMAVQGIVGRCTTGLRSQANALCDRGSGERASPGIRCSS